MKMRKFYFMMLALVLAVTMGIPSFAEDGAPADPVQGEDIAADDVLPEGDADATEPSDDGDVTEPSDDGDVTEPSDDGNVTEPSDDGDVTEPSDDGDVTEPSEDGDVTEPSEDGDVTEPSDDGDVTEPSDDEDVTEPSEDGEEEEEEKPTIGESEPIRVLPPRRLMMARAATVDVAVPGSGKVLINPCRLPVRLEGESGPKSTDQIVSKTMYIRNRSSSSLTMNVTVQGVIGAGSDIRLVSDTPDSDATTKSLFLYAEFKPTQDGVEPVWEGRFRDRDYQIPVTTTSRKRSEVLTLRPSGQDKSCAAMRIFGAAVMQPKTPWTVNDKVEVTLTFDFREP